VCEILLCWTYFLSHQLFHFEHIQNCIH
jgi:hypothetical protein